LAAGVAYLGGPIAHYQNDLVAQVLELPQFAKPHHVTQVNIRAAGVKPHLQAQGLTPLQHPHEFIMGYDLADAAPGYPVNRC
jgi:hypothetical protein